MILNCRTLTTLYHLASIELSKRSWTSWSKVTLGTTTFWNQILFTANKDLNTWRPPSLKLWNLIRSSWNLLIMIKSSPSSPLVIILLQTPLSNRKWHQTLTKINHQMLWTSFKLHLKLILSKIPRLIINMLKWGLIFLMILREMIHILSWSDTSATWWICILKRLVTSLQPEKMLRRQEEHMMTLSESWKIHLLSFSTLTIRSRSSVKTLSMLFLTPLNLLHRRNDPVRLS